jgi:hypothetical protein
MITKSDRRKISRMIRRSPTPSTKRLISDAFLEPWFLDLETARSVQRIIPPKYSRRMRWFFDDFGCIRCKGKESGYGGNGFCVNCRYTIVSGIVRSIRKRSKSLNEKTPPAFSRSSLRRIEVAERLLGDLAASGL